MFRLATWMPGARTRRPARPEPPPDQVNSPLMGRLAEQLAAAEAPRLLDLGPACGALLELFGQERCKFRIADCAAGLLELNARGPEPTPFGVELERLLPLDEAERYDAVLFWDLLNYLDKPLLKALMLHLGPVTSGDTWLHAYVWGRRQMPAAPAHYRLTRDGKLLIRPTTTELTGCPCYTQPDLRGLMQDFQVARSTLLQNGFQEYLFRGEGAGHREVRSLRRTRS